MTRGELRLPRWRRWLGQSQHQAWLSFLTLDSISSLIVRTSSMGFPFGSCRSQSMSFFRIFASIGRGHTASTEHPIVTTSSALSIISFVSIFGEVRDNSNPFSLIASTTTGFTLWDGIVPALEASSPYFLAKASAIWLLPAFSTHTNNIDVLDIVSTSADPRPERPEHNSGEYRSQRRPYPIDDLIRVVAREDRRTEAPRGVE